MDRRARRRRRRFVLPALVLPALVLPAIIAFGSRGVSTAGAAQSTTPLECMRRFYGAYIAAVETETGEDGGKQGVVFVMKNGRRILFDDGKSKTATERLEAPDLQDAFVPRYPVGTVYGPAQKDADPGRSRSSAFFAAVYGNSEEAVREQLTEVRWPGPGKRVRLFNRNAGAAAALARVAEGVSSLSADGRRVVRAVGGTFNHRRIAGTDRLSAHAFGIAIDVDVRRSAYWRWSRSFPRFVNNIPRDVVDLFEKNGFIWGGKWYHFDTMHFEYRPELLCAGTVSPPS